MSRGATRFPRGCLLALLAAVQATAAGPAGPASPGTPTLGTPTPRPPAPDPAALSTQAPGAAQPGRVVEAADAALAGHYTLQGIMETGSELLLRADGRFQWYFSYGALDLAAQGAWGRHADTVVLVTEYFQAPPGYEGMAFERLRLRIDGRALIPAWPWDDGKERGSYVND